MMTVARLTCLWPGLARLWFRGEWAGLAAACGFAGIVNFLLVTSLLWPELAPAPLRAAGFVIAALWWGLGVVMSLREWEQLAAATKDDPHQGLFVAAQTEYLKGNWLEAEAHLRKLLRRRPRDVESLLLVASIARRTGRLDEARANLQNLARWEAAARWQTEIRCERELLRRLTEQRRLEQLEKEHTAVETNEAEAKEEQNDNLPQPEESQIAENDVNSEDESPPQANSESLDEPWDHRRAA